MGKFIIYVIPILFIYILTLGTLPVLKNILPKVKASKNGWLPVISSNRNMIGVITKSAIESKIVDEVVAAKKLAL